MAKMTRFQFGGFYDVPRHLTLRCLDKMFYLKSEFNEELDDYESTYSVYEIDESVADSAQSGSWDFRKNTQMTYIGDIQIADVRFDPRKHEELDATCLDALIDRAIRALRPQDTGSRC